MAEDVEQKLKVFLCHAPEDYEVIRALYDFLIKKNYDVWLDDINLIPGADRELVIPTEVAKSDVVIICLSEASIQNAGDFQRELNEALAIAKSKPEGTIYIIPARLDECDVPRRLSALGYVDLFKEGGYERLIRALDHKSNPKQENNKQLNQARRKATSPPPIVEPIPNPKPPLGCELRLRVFLLTLVGIIVATIAFIAGPPLLELFNSSKIPCSNLLQDVGVLIKPVQEVELVSESKVVGTPVQGVHGKLLSQGSVELSGLYSEKIYSLTLNGKLGNPPNNELREINHIWSWGEGYWDFMTVTADSAGNIRNQYLLAALPPGVTLCSGRHYRAKFFVKDAMNNTILGTDDFSFIVESSDSIPYILNINISTEPSIGKPNPIPTIQMTSTTPPPKDLSFKGDSPVKVNVQTLNPSGAEISPDTLNYHWELCCDDKQNKTPDDSRLPTWKFKPPTYLSTEMLTITVSNEKGYSVEVKIPFTINTH